MKNRKIKIGLNNNITKTIQINIKKVKKILNNQKLREKYALKFTYFKSNKNKNNTKKMKFKIDINQIKKIRENINRYKYSFANVKKCLVYSFYYEGNKDINKKLKVSKIEINEEDKNNFIDKDAKNTHDEIIINLEKNSNNEENNEENILNSKDIMNLIITKSI